MFSVPLIIIIVTTIIELFVCHISLWLLIAMIGRALFSLRMVGAMFKQKTLYIFEGVAIVGKILWAITLGQNNFRWSNMLLFIFFAAVCIVTEFIDDMLYVYTTDEDEDYDAYELQSVKVTKDKVKPKSNTKPKSSKKPSSKKKGSSNVKNKGTNKGKGNKRNGSTKAKSRR